MKFQGTEANVHMCSFTTSACELAHRFACHGSSVDYYSVTLACNRGNTAEVLSDVNSTLWRGERYPGLVPDALRT